MSSRWVLAILPFTAACGPAVEPAPPLEEGSSSRQDIVGGTTTSEFPAAVAIARYGAPHCTGTVVGPRTVLTAAHCLEGVTASSLKVVIGASLGAAEAVLPVSAITPHPDYDSQKLENDIGTVTLGADAPVTPIKLLPSMDASWAGRTLTFVGYGITSGYGKGSGVKRSVSMPIHSVMATQFSYKSPGKNTCNGDSGGPAFAQVGGEWFVAGVTSYGDAGCNVYGVDTRVDTFASFVLGEETQSGSGDPCQGETWQGRCDGSTVVWCENGGVKTLDCSSCGWVAAKGYYDCT